MRNYIRLSLAILLVLALAFGAVACGGGDAEQTEAEGDASEKILVGTDTSFVPFGFEEDGEYKGFDIDMLEEFAKELGFEYELMPMDFKGLVPALQTGNVDIVLAGMTITEDREEVVDFATPYYDSGLIIMVNSEEDGIEGIEDLDGKIVATKLGTTSVTFCESIEGLKELKQFDNIDGAYFELQKGGADAVIFDAPAILYYIKTEGGDKVKTVGPIYEGQQYGIAFPKGSEFREEIDEVLVAMMEDGRYDEIYEKWFGQRPDTE
ncbi:MAG: glutamine ABC transporter substrate-binding protein GlnH [Clostridia bacterium]|nr:glutamine ABC transporter substrate-binding protein GlnH [Clostridia bacterium]